MSKFIIIISIIAVVTFIKVQMPEGLKGINIKIEPKYEERNWIITH